MPKILTVIVVYLKRESRIAAFEAPYEVDLRPNMPQKWNPTVVLRRSVHRLGLVLEQGDFANSGRPFRNQMTADPVSAGAYAQLARPPGYYVQGDNMPPQGSNE